jgi:hypothetical protein
MLILPRCVGMRLDILKGMRNNQCSLPVMHRMPIRMQCIRIGIVCRIRKSYSERRSLPERRSSYLVYQGIVTGLLRRRR